MSEIYTLGNGRNIEYKVYGAKDGYSILGCHGLAGSVFAEGTDAMIKGIPIRYILIARPGYGRSDFFMLENIAEWPGIIEPLLEHLKIDDFDVIGLSAGAPYAYSLAVAYPDKVKNVFINKGLGAIYKPEVLALYPDGIEEEIGIYKNGSLDEIAEQIQRSYIAHFTDEQKKIPYIRDSIVGGCMGMASCGKLEFSDWGFAVEDVAQPVLMFHCRDDQEVPFSTAEKTKEYLKNAELIAHDTGGHMSEALMMDMMNRIIALYS